jgi:apolipoprotein N-acyltransferase
VALEFLRANFLGGFPWIPIAASQYRLVPLIQLASVTGVYGISFLVIWLALALYSGARLIYLHPTKRYIWQGEIVLPLATVVVLFGLGMARASRETPAAEHLRVTIVQPSIPQSMIWSPTADAIRFQDLLAQSQKALTNQTDLLLWPESAVPSLDEITSQQISQFARSNHVWIILNSDDVEFHPDATNYFNSAFLVDPTGVCKQVYHKQRLVIFGEYVPLTGWLPFLKLLTPIVGGWTPGTHAVQFVIRPDRFANIEKVISIGGSPEPPARQMVKVSPLICFEDVFPGLSREAVDGDTDFLVNLTNDGWFGHGAAQWQQAATAVFRAVENGIPLVRCANNGVSCLISADGLIQQVVADSTGDIHGLGTMTVDVPLPDSRPTPTFYHRHGEWFAWSCAVLTILTLGRNIFERRKA